MFLLSGFQYCQVFFDNSVPSEVWIKIVQCEFGYRSFWKYGETLKCEKDALVVKSKLYPNKSYCNIENSAYNELGNMYFEKDNRNIEQCVVDTGKCSPFIFKPGR